MINESKTTTPHKKKDDFEFLDPDNEWATPVTYSPSFLEKRRKAIEILKESPLPEELIKEMAERKNRLKQR